MSVLDAVPGWTILLGAQAQSHIGHNQVAFGSSAVSIFGPNYHSPAFEGRFELLLMAGVDANNPSTPLNAFISQAGVIPFGSMSIQFAALPGSFFPGTSGIRLELDGHTIPLQVLSTSGEHVIIGGDVSSFAGQTAELKIIGLANLTRYNVFALDDITFSAVPIPEPSTWAFLGIGALLLATRLRLRPT